MGVVIIRAMAQEHHSCIRYGGIPDVIEDGQNGYLVNYGDIQAMASSITKLLSDEKLREKMGAKGKEKAKNYIPHKIAIEHLNLYNRMLC